MTDALPGEGYDDTDAYLTWVNQVAGDDPEWLPPPQPTPTTATITHPARSEFTDEKGTIQIPALASYVQDTGHIRIGTDSRLYHYARGVYRPDGETFARSTVREVLGPKWRTNHGNEVANWLLAHWPSITDAPPEPYINCANGLLDWRTGTLRGHTPDVPTTTQLPIAWDPEAACPAFDAFLTEALPADAVDLAYEFIGLCCYSRNPFRKAALCLGPTGTGKTRFILTVAALLGADNISTVTLQAFSESRFAAAELYGKLANIAGDLDARSVERTDIFKMVTGGDPIQAERKYGQPFNFTPRATLLFAANEAPISSDQTDAWYERWIILPFENRPAKPDPRLIQRLTAPTELSGILTRSVEGLRSLMARGEFTAPHSVATAGDDYRTRVDSIVGFLADQCDIGDPEDWTPRQRVYKAYRDWCSDGGRKALGRENFNNRIRSDLHLTETKRKGIYGWPTILVHGDQGALLPSGEMF